MEKLECRRKGRLPQFPGSLTLWKVAGPHVDTVSRSQTLRFTSGAAESSEVIRTALCLDILFRLLLVHRNNLLQGDVESRRTLRSPTSAAHICRSCQFYNVWGSGLDVPPIHCGERRGCCCDYPHETSAWASDASPIFFRPTSVYKLSGKPFSGILVLTPDSRGLCCLPPIFVRVSMTE